MISYLKSNVEETLQQKSQQEEKLPPERISMLVNPNTIILIDNTNKDLYLKINRDKFDCQLLKLSELNIKEIQPIKFFGIFGVISVKEIDFLVLVSEAKVVGSVMEKAIYQVLSVKFLPIQADKNQEQKFDVSWEHLEKIKGYLTTGFYFSYDYPLHLTMDNEGFFKKKVFDDVESIFVWNSVAFSQLMKIEEHKTFFVPMI